ncbi:MAG: M23 family metallopeptidase [Bacteroidia bacterium]|nr:M23 family metallopeptidase [Bacteroidia bacterium]
MRRKPYKFLSKYLEFRRATGWKYSQIAQIVLFLVIAIGSAWVIVNFLFYWWPTQSLRKKREENKILQKHLIDMTHHKDTLYRLSHQIEKIEKEMYTILVPPSQEAKANPYKDSSRFLASLLSSDTLAHYLAKIEALFIDITRAEGVLSSPEIRSSRLPRSLPCACEALGAGYGLVTHPILGTTYPHQGVDFLAGEGTLVWSTAEGIVVRVEAVPGTDAYKVCVQHTPILCTIYYPLLSTVQVGQWVLAGTPIGRVARIPLSKAPFLHYEVWIQGESVNPLMYLWGHFSYEERQQWQAAFSQQAYALH